jgi:hypothetical protein
MQKNLKMPWCCGTPSSLLLIERFKFLGQCFSIQMLKVKLLVKDNVPEFVCAVLLMLYLWISSWKAYIVIEVLVVNFPCCHFAPTQSLTS